MVLSPIGEIAVTVTILLPSVDHDAVTWKPTASLSLVKIPS